eukprot:TRINITY_DN2345_c0_g1_i1.p3 TRINITY_DN2345_c0_g1~~TRINITY_DN2345_c0_g1_i1.p3  ORF type:complete len:129 (+),score=12.29 TRINITY_DN2345_c0_g1_i1:242-628(+)
MHPSGSTWKLAANTDGFGWANCQPSMMTSGQNSALDRVCRHRSSAARLKHRTVNGQGTVVLEDMTTYNRSLTERTVNSDVQNGGSRVTTVRLPSSMHNASIAEKKPVVDVEVEREQQQTPRNSDKHAV